MAVENGKGERRGGGRECFLFLFVMTGWISDRLIDRGRDLPKHSPEDRLATTTQPEIDYQILEITSTFNDLKMFECNLF